MTSRTVDSHLVIVSPPELAAGFRLAGVAVRVAADPIEAGAVLEQIVADGERGVVAVYEPYLAALDDEARRRLDSSVSPVVVGLPTGLGAGEEGGRRALLVARLQRAVGYRITFGGEGS